MIYTVEGSVIQKFSLIVDANSEAEAMKKAEEFAVHNVVAEYVDFDYVGEGDVR